MNVRKNKNNKKKILLWIASAVAVLALVIASLELLGIASFFSKSQPSEPTQSTVSQSEDNNGNSGGEETQNSPPEQDANKEKSSRSNSATESSSKKKVTPVITYASNSSSDKRVFGYVPGIVEGDGTCTFTFSGNGSVVKKTDGVEDVSKTNCATTPPSGSGWSVVLAYSSDQAEGISQKVKVN